MLKHNPRRIEIKNLNEAKNKIEDIGCDPKSVDIMAPKAVFRTLLVSNVKMQDAIIIKQEMLSIGGEVAVPQDVFELRDKNCTILIMGTLKQFKELVKNLRRQYSRIKEIANEINDIMKKEGIK